MKTIDRGRLQGRLLDILLEIPALDEKENRDALLFRLPARGIVRAQMSIPDLQRIIIHLDALGQLSNGEWPLVILISNALRFAPADTDLGRRLVEILPEFETSTNRHEVGEIPEVVIGVDERLPVAFLGQAMRAQRSVARLVVRRFENGCSLQSYSAGTGWLLGDGLLMTNYHVIAVREPDEPRPSAEDLNMQARSLVAWFNYNTSDQKHSDYACVELVQANPRLDYALLRLSEQPVVGKRPLSLWGKLNIVRPASHLHPNERLNIIQHPLGEAKMLAIRSNYYIGVSGTNPSAIHYLTDTQPGASGSPVFNDRWEVVALHHSSVRVNPYQHKDVLIRFHNEGILLSAILDDIHDQKLLARLFPSR